MSDYDDIKAVLESPGMKLITRELNRRHIAASLEYRNASTMEQVLNLQSLQKVIDTALPEIYEELMNKHIEQRPRQRSHEWWDVSAWIKKVLQ